MIERDWHNLYSDGWNGQITPDAYAHPAKFARGLIRRIYQHALGQGYLKPGDVVLDPFGGVALGAIDAISLGLDWVGMELEEKFVKLGADNIALWEHQRRGQRHIDNLPELGAARLLQGDSRYLCDVLGEAGGVVSSPPYAETATAKNSDGVDIQKQYQTYRSQGGGQSFEAFYETQKRHSQGYGTTPGQLGAMRVVSSPPYAESVNQSDGANDAGARLERKEGAGIDITHKPNVGGPNSVLNKPQVYGQSAGQLGRMRVVSSPPYEGTMNDSREGGERRIKLAERAGYDRKYLEQKYGYGQTLYAQEYGASDGQLGTETGNDFWQAARQIMEQVALVLPTGAVAIWVLKAFVRNKDVVNFPMQWRQLGEACGFETLEWIRAWLVEDRGTQHKLFGGVEHKTVERKSFFRRLAESKGSPPIDFEVVLIQRLIDD